MAKKLLIDGQMPGIDGATMERYKLKEIKPDSEKDILSEQTPFSLSVTFPDGVHRTIKQEQLKLKNFGDFYRLIRDQRVETLLSHFSDNTIDCLTLKKELEEYDSVRVDIFELIHRFEMLVIEKKNIQTPSPNFVEILSHCPEIDRETKQQIQIIRNAFSHNTYPKAKDSVCDVENKDTKVEVTFSLGGSMPNMAGDLKTRLEKLVENSLIKLNHNK
jgi:hypothetical protein